LAAAIASRTIGGGSPGSAPERRRRTSRSAASALLAGNWKRVIPESFHAMPQNPAAVSKMV